MIRGEALVKRGINSAVADCAKPRSVLPFTASGRSAFVDGLAARIMSIAGEGRRVTSPVVLRMVQRVVLALLPRLGSHFKIGVSYASL